MATNSSKSAARNTKNASKSEFASVQSDLSNPDFSIPFFHYLEIPKNTTKENPLTYTMSLPIGIINRLWVEFPRGCSGLAGVQVYRSIRQVFPLPDGVWLRSDNAVLNFAFSHQIKNEPYEIILQGYNLDDTYNHTIWLGFEMSGNKAALTPAMLSFLNTLQGG